MAETVCTIFNHSFSDIDPAHIACIQCLRAKRRRSLKGRRERSVRRLRMGLYLHCLLRIHCLVDHSWHWSALQRPGSKEVCIGIAFPISHDCSRVCSRFSCKRGGRFLLSLTLWLGQPSNGSSGVIRWHIPATLVLSSGHLRISA